MKLSLEEMLDKLSENMIGPLNNECLTCNDIGHFWKDFVEPILPNKDRVIEFYKMLMDYITDREAIFIIRDGGRDWRRGMLTTIKNTNKETCKDWPEFRFVYADNDFASIILQLVFDDRWDLNYDEFKNLMTSYQMPLRFRSGDEHLAAFLKHPAQRPDFAAKGYKISHLFAVGRDFNLEIGTSKKPTRKKILRHYNLLGDDRCWKLGDDGVYVRKTDYDLPWEAINFLKAHFLRFVCPFNFFLTPKKTCQRFSEGKCKDIGEWPVFLDYVYNRLKERYSPEFDEFVNMIMLPDCLKNPVDKPETTKIDLEYGKELCK